MKISLPFTVNLSLDEIDLILGKHVIAEHGIQYTDLIDFDVKEAPCGWSVSVKDRCITTKSAYSGKNEKYPWSNTVVGQSFVMPRANAATFALRAGKRMNAKFKTTAISPSEARVTRIA